MAYNPSSLNNPSASNLTLRNPCIGYAEDSANTKEGKERTKKMRLFQP